MDYIFQELLRQRAAFAALLEENADGVQESAGGAPGGSAAKAVEKSRTTAEKSRAAVEENRTTGELLSSDDAFSAEQIAAVTPEILRAAADDGGIQSGYAFSESAAEEDAAVLTLWQRPAEQRSDPAVRRAAETDKAAMPGEAAPQAPAPLFTAPRLADTLSRSIEQDARRYDGGYTLY